MMFSTASRVNSPNGTACVKTYKAPWWYNHCHKVLLTGRYGEYPNIKEDEGIKWFNPWGNKKFSKEAVMMIKPVN